MALFSCKSRLGSALAVLVAAACGSDNGTGPTKLLDPLATAAHIQAIGAAFSAPVFQSLRLASQYSPAAASALRAASALLGAAQPALSAHRILTPTQGRLIASALRAALVESSGPISAVILPPEILGMTFEWDTVGFAGYVVTDRHDPDVPANGVRFILYELDGSGLPVRPLHEFAYADLTDESGAAQQLHVVVAVHDPAATYLDYTISRTGTAPSTTVTVAGYITDGTRRLDFSVVLAETANSAAFDIRFDVNAADAHAQLKLTFTAPAASTLRLVVDLRLQFGSEVVSVTGTDTANIDTGAESGTLTVRVNGGLYATMTLTNGDVTFAGAGGQGLTGEDRIALQAMYDVFAEMLNRADDLLAPGGAGLAL